MAYGSAFARPPRPLSGLFIITSHRGLLPAETPIALSDLEAFSQVPISEADDRYRIPLEQSARRLRAALPSTSDVILLGSIATGKYVDVLRTIFREQLLFPVDFVGRGDMSRGGLMLRSAASGHELSYRPVDGAPRRGSRPARLSDLPSKPEASAPSLLSDPIPMSDRDPIDKPRREKENMTEPQEEFIQDSTPPSASRPAKPKSLPKKAAS